MKTKTSELIDAALDWAVAECQGYEYLISNINGIGGYYIRQKTFSGMWTDFDPSTDWYAGGPIVTNLIEAGYTICKADYSLGFKVFKIESDSVLCSYGDTPLIAVMRCYVSSILGDEVDIPEELT